MGSIPAVGRRGASLLVFLALALICAGPAVRALPVDEHLYVILEEGFEDFDPEGWDMWAPQGASPDWAVLYDEGNDVLSLEGAAIAMAGDPGWRDYTLEVRVKHVGGVDEAHIGVRMGDPTPRYFVRFTDQGVYLTKDWMGEFPDLAEWATEREGDVWYTFRVVCSGGGLWVYVDDELRLEFVDDEDPVLSGRIGLESGPGGQFYFDDVRVYVTHFVYVEHLIGVAEGAINEARVAGVDTGRPRT